MLPVRRDPAPSRIKYRLERLWLTPLIRRTVRTGLPLLALAALLGATIAHPRVQAEVDAAVAAVSTALAAHPDLTVTALDIQGASAPLAAEIERRLALDLPQSALDLDLTGLRAAIALLEPVADVEARYGTDGRLTVVVKERVPVAILKGPDRFDLIDPGGVRTGTIPHRLARPDLPLLAGVDAGLHVAEAKRLLALAAPVKRRIRGLVRVGTRRWNLVLAPDLTVLLPENAPEAALRRLMALQAAKALLDRDLVAGELRDPARPVVRLSPGGLAACLGTDIPPEEGAL